MLLASPAMDDSYFAEAVIVMIDDNEEGSLGLVLNQPSGMALDEAWSQVSAVPCPREAALLRGGPVPGPLMVLHGQATHADREVVDGVFLSSEEMNVRALVMESDSPAMFFAGYAGWGPGQLAEELKQTSWIVGPPVGAWVLEHREDPRSLWRACVKMVDPSLGRLSENPDIVPYDPGMN